MLHSHPTLEDAYGLDSKYVIVDVAEYEEALRRLATPPSVALSKRNLLSLLHKLEMPGSERTIIKPTPNGNVVVSVVPDEEAYRNRPAGPMHPETEQFIVDMEVALAYARRMQADRCCKKGCGGCCGR